MPGFLKKVFGKKEKGHPAESPASVPGRKSAVAPPASSGRPPLVVNGKSEKPSIIRRGVSAPATSSNNNHNHNNNHAAPPPPVVLATAAGKNTRKKLSTKNDKADHASLSGQSSEGEYCDLSIGRSSASRASCVSRPPTSVVVTTGGGGDAHSVSPPATAATSCNNSACGEDDNSSHGETGECLSVISGASSFKKASLKRSGSFASSNPKNLAHSTSAIGLDEMIEDRREIGDLRQNVVHIEVPFGKPIEEVYDGVHNGPVLGSGISGMVRLVSHKATGIKYAVKVLDLGLVETPTGLQQLREEIFIMCQLDHPNIVRLEEVYESHTEIYLVQELCVGGELFDRLDEQPDYHYTEAECARLVKQMLSAVRYLHSKGIIHRDLKLENFLFSGVDTESELKMIDFGLSKHFRYGEILHEAVGTPYTVAPEVIRGSYDERCDIWAIGVITFLLLSGEPPFGGCGGPEPLMAVRGNILNGSYSFEPQDIWELVTPGALKFIQSLLVTDPKKRPTAQRAQQHEWFQYWARRNRDENDHVLNPNVVKALVNFKEFSDMRKLLCEVLSFTLLPDQIRDLRREFEKMDTDGSGEISFAALKQVLMKNAGDGSLGALTEEEVTDIFDAMRVRKTETRIHWHEFIAAGLSQCSVDDRNLRLAFERLDSDHKGYITLDDIMDLMGSDALQSEEAMRRMWGDSIKAVKCQHARITYDDFLLLMKGQTRDHPPDRKQAAAKASGGGKPPMMPPPPPIAPAAIPLLAAAAPEIVAAALGSSLRNLQAVPESNPLENMTDAPALIPATPLRGLPVSQSAPSTPADHKKIIDIEDDFDSPLSMDDEMPVQNLTPRLTPERGAKDYISPRLTDDVLFASSSQGSPFLTPPLPDMDPFSNYLRRRSKSLGERTDDPDGHDTDGPDNNLPAPVGSLSEFEDADASGDFNVVADVVRDMLLPEHEHNILCPTELEEMMNDKTKSALVVNRHLYRAHRQMRMAILEASKRFEEQQAQHAKEMILAQRMEESEDVDADADDSHSAFHAGLVMRHGHTKQVSLEAIKAMLAQNRAEQQSLLEKATRRGGRGRRSRKKTVSDMSGMVAAASDEFSLTPDLPVAGPGSPSAQSQSLRNVAVDIDPNDISNSENPDEDPLNTVSEPLPAVVPESLTPLGNEVVAASKPPLHRGVTEPAALKPSLKPPAAPPPVPKTVEVQIAAAVEIGSDKGAKEGPMRSATVPGEFRETHDPFGSKGIYGAISKWQE